MLAPTGRDASLACRVLADAALRAVPCRDMAGLCRELERGAGAVMIAEEALDPASVQRLEAALAAQPPWSDLPVIVLAGSGWQASDAPAPLGNVTVLNRPVGIASLMSAVQSALRARRRQYQVRDLLAEVEREREREREHAEALRQARDEAQALNRQKDEFLAMLSHELRNPMAPILNAVELLKALGPQEPRLERARAIIERQARHQARLIDDLLDVSRVSRGKIELQRELLDVREAVERVVETFAAEIEAKRHRLTLSLPPEPLWVEADATRLDQILGNLLRNAVKYTDEGGEILLAARREGPEAVLELRDNGAGIAADLLPHVFELFTQADRTLARSGGGLGIGLTLVKSLVELHGGRVTAHSDGPNQGSAFIVCLPIADRGLPIAECPTTTQSTHAVAGEIRTPHSALRTPEAPHSRRVLIIEDNPDSRETLREVLEMLGHRVTVASSGPEGVAAAAESLPEVALVDIGLPGFDGYEVARQLRGLGNGHAPRPGSLPGNAPRPPHLIAVTGYGKEEDRRQAQEAGFDDHLTKPIDVAALERLLASR